MLGLRCRHGARLMHCHGVRRVRPTEAPWHNLFVHSASIHSQLRGVKTKTTVRLADLPQGPIKSNASESREDDDEPSYPTVVLQARRNMRRFANCVLITRVGGFYELYFEHADEYAPLLNLKLASKKTNAGPVPMAGFPFFQLDRYLKILVQDLNCYVAIAEEFPNDAADKVKSGGLMHDRKVARIISPGTLIDENFIDPYANNYVMAIHVSQDFHNGPTSQSAAELSSQSTQPPLGLAWLDLSTGQFFTQVTDMVSLSSILSRIGPKEVVLSADIENQEGHDIFSILAEDRHLITYASQGEMNSIEKWTPLLESKVPESTRRDFADEEVHAGNLVLNYVKERLQGTTMKLLPPLRHESMQIMGIDRNSMRALEIKQTIRDGFFKGSLLHAVRRTVTKSGARLLNEWISAPSTSLEVINARLDLVSRFLADEDFRDATVLLLRRCHDSQRLVQKFSLGRGDADDLLALASTIHATQDIVLLLTETLDSLKDPSQADCMRKLLTRTDLTQPLKLAKKIKDSIDEEGIVHQHEVEDSEANQMMALAQNVVAIEASPSDTPMLPKGKKKQPTSIREYYAEDNDAWIMKPGASINLRKLHGRLASLLDEQVTLGDSLRQKFGAASLTLRWTPALGHIAHVKGKDVKSLKDVRALSSSRTTTSFHLPEWTALGQRLDQARFHIRREEQRVFQMLREQVVVNLVKLRRNAAVLDEIDIATSFARLATEQRLTRPKLNNSTVHTIIGGRHPTVECGLREQGLSFVQNDCLVGTPSDGLAWLITGPNMAGKSTFLRQNALMTILAQIGCFVPASYAEMGIVDAIFSRVGSADNLYRNESTFMVEMLETAQILRRATPRSFVIMDEIGRGTTPEDGTAISYACLHHLVTVNQCRTLFATHFHKVADLADADGLCSLDGLGGPVQLYCTDVEEADDKSFVYVHKLRRGINRKSHALKVASLAKLPERAIEMAKLVLDLRDTKA